ncbi:MAG: mechanosensitive ion channel family protein [Candidatus Thermoplasmatota archaeon]|nr:mechanosensitive ion channel family protein [Candidatus Thermoplasmatota archaeon]
MVDLPGFMDDLDVLNDWAKLGISIGLVLLAVIFTRYAIVRPWLRIVTMTKVEWDDQLHRPISKRLYTFVMIGGLNISLNWVYGKDGDLMISLTPFFSAAYIILATTIASVSLSHIVPAFMDRYADKSTVTVSGSNPLITFFLRAVVWFAGLYLALSELEIELVGLLASLAVFSLIIGLAVQQTLGNIVNSFMLAMDQPFEVGDRIEVEGTLGSVVSVGILSTKVLTREEKLVVIPNNTLVQSTVINHARGGGDGVARRISIVVEIGVDYQEDIDHVKFVLLNVARECPYVIDSPEPRVLLTELGDFAKTFRLFGWVDDYSEEWVARDWLLKAVDEKFSEDGIMIPYPTGVELKEKPDEGTISKRSKSAKQRAAKIQMTMEEEKLREEREKAKQDLEDIQEQLKAPDLDNKEKSSLEAEARELQKILLMFDDD